MSLCATTTTRYFARCDYEDCAAEANSSPFYSDRLRAEGWRVTASTHYCPTHAGKASA